MRLRTHTHSYQKADYLDSKWLLKFDSPENWELLQLSVILIIFSHAHKAVVSIGLYAYIHILYIWSYHKHSFLMCICMYVYIDMFIWQSGSSWLLLLINLKFNEIKITHKQRWRKRMAQRALKGRYWRYCELVSYSVVKNDYIINVHNA